MIGFARFAMKSRLHAGALAAGLAALPILYAVSAALVALVTLRQGTNEGTRLLVLSLIGALVGWQTSGAILPLLVLPITAILATVMREFQDWRMTLLSAAVLGLVLAFGAQLAYGDRFAAVVGQFQQMLTGGEAESPLWQMLEAVKPNAAYLILTAQMFEVVLCLILARYWQAGLYNPGGFRAEFHALRLNGRMLLALLVAAAFMYVVKPAGLLMLLIPLVFAGAALVHGMVAKAKLGGQWLVAFYIGAILFNQFVLPILVLVAIADGYFNFRGNQSQPPDRNND
ncbi:MAG: hypothetical protein ACX931_04945 [Saccharospirillum sp.]